MSRTFIAGGVALFAASFAFAQTPRSPGSDVVKDTVELELLTHTEVYDKIHNQNMTSVLVVTGGTEERGPHDVLGGHTIMARRRAIEIAKRLGQTLVAPVIAYVPEGRVDAGAGHMRFPGTITVSEETFQKVLESAARSFKLHGVKDIVFLGDHGSTQADQRTVAARLNREWASGPARVHAVEEYYRAATVDFPQLLRSRGYRDDEVGTHAGLADTSLMLALDPRLVRAGVARPGPEETTGVSGDPSRASAELGQLGVELIVSRTVEAIRKSVARR